MKEFAGLLLAVLSIVSYVVVATGYGLYQRWPLLHLLGCLIACVWLVRVTLRRRGGRRILAVSATVLTFALTGLFAWWTLDYSAYASTEPAVAVGEPVGERLAEMRLAAHDGTPTAVLRPGEDRATLLVFYRGHW